MGLWGEIKCEIIHTALDENVIPYEAVSYRWGSSMKRESILVQGQRLNVTSNLYRILHDLRYSNADRYLWIDAICINQEDVSERGHQVVRMRDIYSRAVRVIFFVGRSTMYTDNLLAALAELQSKTYGNSWGREDERWDEAWVPIESGMEKQFPNTRRLFRRALIYIMEQSWFRRVWVLQEVGNAKSAIVYCGRASVLARVFAVAPRLLGINLNSHHKAVFELMPGPSRQLSKIDRDFYSLLQRFSMAEAQDERDKVYALLGMCTCAEADKLIPNYSNSVEEVIRDTILCIWHYDIRNLPRYPYTRMDRFLADLNKLDGLVLAWFIKSGDIDGILYHIHYRGHRISITGDAVTDILESECLREQIIEALLQQRNNRSAIAIGAKSLLNWIKLEGFDNMCGRFFLNYAIDIDMRGDNGQTPLLVATKYGQSSAIRLLIRRGADIEARDGNENTPLLLASKQGYIEIMQVLLNSGANIGAKDYDGNTPLLLASMHGDVEIIRLLLSCGAKFEADDNNKSTRRLYNLLQRNSETSLIGLSCGAYVGIGGTYGRAPLISAIKQGCIEAIKLLLRHCPNTRTMIMTKDIYGKTPLLLAAEVGALEIVRLLINYGSDIEAKDQSGITPLGLAVSHGHTAKVRLLLDEGADIDAKDSYDRTPFLLAVKRGLPSVTAMFLERYSDIEAKERCDEAEKEIKGIETRFSQNDWPWYRTYLMRPSVYY
ncbi:ankyrin repeat-containing domain protein [Annulohypoxylon maeteangense]|uniref:ankyrin repeat-containing domain protein n=1 Tax=Annulohypoxylon maeteangense TaxID=1927788 RepID=UPI00200743F6|nr:ankyrin repeat-containing domain protein [Annulohypoxylon maeteangense]KAI0889650.1 ankyrin repeat-containing domain protein [Annulohypoxylon maeteangense]